MAQLKAGSTIGVSDIANINLEGVSRTNFSATHLAEIRGNNGANGANGAVGKSTTNLTSSNNSNINLANVTSVVYNGSNLGYHKVYLNGTRIYEKYQVDNTYQTWITEGHNETTWPVATDRFFNDLTGANQWIMTNNVNGGSMIGSWFYYYNSSNIINRGGENFKRGSYIHTRPGGGHPRPIPMYQALRETISWIDTSHFITEGSIDDTYYY